MTQLPRPHAGASPPPGQFGTPGNGAVRGHEAEAGEPLGPWERRQVHTSMIERIAYMTQLADGKAAPLLALQATLAAVLVSSADKFEGLFDSGQPALAQAGAAVLVAVYAVSAAIVLVLTLSVYFPVLSRGRGSVLFFEDVRHMDLDDYVERSRNLSHEEVEDDLLAMIHASSAIASSKFHKLRWAFALSAVSLATWLPLMAWAGF